MRLFLKVSSRLGITKVETGQEMVNTLGFRGALNMLKNRAFARIPSVRRHDCTTSVTYQDAHLTDASAAPLD